jgi:hypothetical protein
MLITRAAAGAEPPAAIPIRFTDAQRQATEFIAYDQATTLTPGQQSIMQQGLSAVPAPCCAQYSIATCCCPCNLARSVWGLSKMLITQHHADAALVKTAANQWLQFSNPHGYSGDACFTGGCNRPFEQNGCGGMDGAHVH